MRSGSDSMGLAMSSAGSFGFCAGPVVERGEVEDSRDQILPLVGSLLLLVEALAGFVAEPFAFEHLREERRELNVGALVLIVGCAEVADDAAENVEADHVGEAKGSGLGPAHGLAGERVDFFDAEALALHHAEAY